MVNEKLRVTQHWQFWVALILLLPTAAGFLHFKRPPNSQVLNQPKPEVIAPVDAVGKWLRVVDVITLDDVRVYIEVASGSEKSEFEIDCIGATWKVFKSDRAMPIQENTKAQALAYRACQAVSYKSSMVSSPGAWEHAPPAAPVRLAERAERKPAAKVNEYTLFRIARENAKARLKDPDSAQFRNQFVGKKGVPCGEVNSKNSFGGYTGFQRFVASGGGLAFFENEVPADEFEELWRQMCI